MTHQRGYARPDIVAALPLAILLFVVPSSRVLADSKSELRFQQGIAAFGAHELGAAREAFESILVKNPEDPAVLRYLGLISRSENKNQEAIGFFRHALELEPNDVLTHIALAETLLGAEQNVQALESLKAALIIAPQHPRLHLYLGIAEYRLQNFESAIRELEIAAALDSNLKREVNYYTGLSQATLGNLYAAAQAFTDLAEASPAHPLGRSARNLRTAMEPSTPEQRWRVNATAGFELDSNPRSAAGFDHPDVDFAGSFNLRGLGDVYRGNGFTLRGGYDGFLIKRIHKTSVDEQTHVARAALLYDYRNLRMSLRYDASITLLDLEDRFRSTHLIEPSLSVRTRRWGITQGFYQAHRFDYYYDLDKSFDLDGWQHSVGLNQIMALSEPFTHVRGGFVWTTRNSNGSEFAYTSFGLNVGTGALLPWNGIEVSALYRFSHLDFANATVCAKSGGCTDSPATGTTKRRENLHEITFNLNLPLWNRLSLDVAGALIFNESNVETFQFDRQIVGAYFTWDFGGKPKFGDRGRGSTDVWETVEEESRFPGE